MGRHDITTNVSLDQDEIIFLHDLLIEKQKSIDVDKDPGTTKMINILVDIMYRHIEDSDE